MKGNFKKVSALFLAILFALSLSACSLENLSVGKLYDAVFNNGEKENSVSEPDDMQQSSETADNSEENIQDESVRIEIEFPDESNSEEITEEEIEEEIVEEEPAIDEPAIENPEIEETVTKEPAVISSDKLTVSTSSVLIEEGDDYNPGTLIDGDINTTWVEGVKGTGAGEWIMIETADGSEINITDIVFVLGFQRNERLFNNNGWPTKVLMEFESGYAQVVDFDDSAEPVTVTLKEAQNTSFVKITILNAVKGAKYDDTCITEITLIGLE